jgi:hypothetical protein
MYSAFLLSVTDLPTLSIRWFKYDRDYLCVNKSQFVPVIFEPPCIYRARRQNALRAVISAELLK